MKTTHIEGYPRYWPDSPDRFVAAKQETDSWVAEVDGTVVGHNALHRSAGDPTFAVAHAATDLAADDLAVVARLFTSTGYRRDGIGRALLEESVRCAAERGQRCVLDVDKGLAGSVAFYDRSGWQRIGEVTIEIREGPIDLWVYLGPASH